MNKKLIDPTTKVECPICHIMFLKYILRKASGSYEERKTCSKVCSHISTSQTLQGREVTWGAKISAGQRGQEFTMTPAREEAYKKFITSEWKAKTAEARNKVIKGKPFQLVNMSKEEFKKRVSDSQQKFHAERRRLGIKRHMSQEQKDLLSRLSKGKKKTTIHTHHIDLDETNNSETNKMRIAPTFHQSLHRQSYRYLLEVYGLDEVKKYIKWFQQKYPLSIIKEN